MHKTKKIALDTEADSLHHYYAKVCLVQLSLDGKNFIIDTLTGMDLSDFMRLLANKPLVLHGADYDLRMLRISFGFRPKREVFDTMLAAQILGYEQFSLVALVQRFVGVILYKRGQKSDWSRRPLSKDQLQYAIGDTRYLESLSDMLQNELIRLGRIDWFRETCENMVESTAQNKTVRNHDSAWRIKGWSKLERRELNFLRQLWHWRENEARKADRPPFKIMNNKDLMNLAIWVASHPRDSLKDGPKLPRHFTGRRLGSLKAVIKQTRTMPKSMWPEYRKRGYPWYLETDYKTEVATLQTECSRIASELGIASSVIATRAALENLVRNQPKTIDEMMACGPMMRWQAELLSPKILPLLTNLNNE